MSSEDINGEFVYQSGLRQRLRGSTPVPSPPPEKREIAFVSPTAKDSLAAVIRVQRAFRRALYRFDRNALIDRLRLELRLEVVGGRVVVWLILLVVVGLNLLSTKESSSYNFTLTSSLQSILGIDDFSSMEYWTEAYAGIDSLLVLFYLFGTNSSGPPTTSTLVVPTVFDENFVHPTTLAGDSYSISTWVSLESLGKEIVALDEAGNTCWTVSVSGTRVELTESGGIDISTAASSRSFLVFLFSDNQRMDVSLDAVSVGELSLPIGCSGEIQLGSPEGVQTSPLDSFYFYPFEVSVAQISDTVELRTPFVSAAASTDLYIFQSVPPLSGAALPFPSSAYEFLTPGILSARLTPAEAECQISGSASSAFADIYGTSTTSFAEWCLTEKEIPLSFESEKTPTDEISNFANLGFIPVSSDTYARTMSLVFPGDLAELSVGNFLVRQLVAIPETNKILLVEFSGEPVGFRAEIFQSFYQEDSKWRKSLYFASGIFGIVVAAGFLIKDVLVFVVNVSVWSQAKREYIKHKVSGVIGNRTKQFAWMVSNLVTNVCVLTLLAGRVGIGFAPDQMVEVVSEVSEILENEKFQNQIKPLYSILASAAATFREYNDWEFFGIIVLYLLFARVIHSLSGHPRVGILTATWRTASDDLFHLSLNFVSLFSLQAVIGLIVLYPKQCSLMSSYGAVLLSQWRALVSGTWDEVSADINVHGADWIQILYFTLFLVTMRILLLHFFIAIMIDAYMAVREAVSKNKAHRSFLRDVVDTTEGNFLVKLGKFPKRPDVIAALIEMYALPIVTIEQLGCHPLFGTAQRGEFRFSSNLQRFCWRYFSHYESLREERGQKQEHSEEAAWRRILAELEVMKKMIGKFDFGMEIQALRNN